MSTSESMSIGPASTGSLLNRDQPRGQRPEQPRGPRPTVSPSLGLARPRQQVRQRVRRPPPVPEQELVPVEEGPPKFALDNDEAIQVSRVKIKTEKTFISKLEAVGC